MFKYTGVKKLVSLFFDEDGKDCGCEERKQTLNRKFPRKYRQANCMTENEYKFVKESVHLYRNRRKLDAQRARKLAEVHARIFKHQLHIPCNNCGGTWETWIKNFEEILSTYE